MGQKVNPIGLAPRHQPHLGLALVRGQEASTASCCTRTSRSASYLIDKLKQAGVSQHRDRAPAQEVPRHDPFGASGRGDRQEGRRHREAAQERRRDAPIAKCT